MMDIGKLMVEVSAFLERHGESETFATDSCDLLALNYAYNILPKAAQSESNLRGICRDVMVASVNLAYSQEG